MNAVLSRAELLVPGPPLCFNHRPATSWQPICTPFCPLQSRTACTTWMSSSTCTTRPLDCTAPSLCSSPTVQGAPPSAPSGGRSLPLWRLCGLVLHLSCWKSRHGCVWLCTALKSGWGGHAAAKAKAPAGKPCGHGTRSWRLLTSWLLPCICCAPCTHCQRSRLLQWVAIHDMPFSRPG